MDQPSCGWRTEVGGPRGSVEPVPVPVGADLNNTFQQCYLAIKSADDVVGLLIPRAQTCSDF